MDWPMGIAVYAVIWWMTIFIVLPWGIRPIDDADVAKGQSAGAPEKPRLLAKMAANTVLAGVVWGVIYWISEAGLIAIVAP
ncbi:MAG: DUF1467 family protein [Rhodospirillales bacterium]|nr:DUF1467 family protein [Rhodospirillales bacterium]